MYTHVTGFQTKRPWFRVSPLPRKIILKRRKTPAGARSEFTGYRAKNTRSRYVWRPCDSSMRYISILHEVTQNPEYARSKSHALACKIDFRRYHWSQSWYIYIYIHIMLLHHDTRRSFPPWSLLSGGSCRCLELSSGRRHRRFGRCLLYLCGSFAPHITLPTTQHTTSDSYHVCLSQTDVLSIWYCRRSLLAVTAVFIKVSAGYRTIIEFGVTPISNKN